MAINSYPDNSGGPIQIPDQLIDPVSKFRVSNPENLIDTDFEYGLQPTKWETVELINNTPSFFSKSGDTTIDGISSIITNAGTREIIVRTELDHGLAVGIPINVTGTKSITADGAYIINSIPDPQTFTYLCKDNQTDTNSILDLYSSIITGEFFQGSQLRISDSDGIVTDAEGTSILTVTTNTTHGFGENTPFYFLNLNSTVAQEFQAANTASKSFDASNSATAQTFDGSNSLSSVSIDWSNSATFGGTPSTVSGTDQSTDTITVTHQAGENFNNLPLGTPLYYSVSATGGYFNTNPRGVVFLKTINQLGTSTSSFKVSPVPDGDVIDLTSNLTGTFQIANQARTFAGNNINPLTQTSINVEVGPSFSFDGGNQGFVTAGIEGTPPSNTLTVLSYTGTAINADGAGSPDYYVGAMVLYTTSGTAPTGLATNTTYFVTSFTNNGGGNHTFSVAVEPGGTPISFTGAGSGTQTFARIGVSLDKNIVHIKDSNFELDDMIEYSFPVDGRFDVNSEEEEKLFYFVERAYDSHNYLLSETVGFKPIEATGGNSINEIFALGRTWRVHTFTSGTSNFVVNSVDSKNPNIQVLVVGGGGGGAGAFAGGGGAGGVVYSSAYPVTPGTYAVTVGNGGPGGMAWYNTTAYPNGMGGNDGQDSVFGPLTAKGGGGGGQFSQTGGQYPPLAPARPGGSGGGGGSWHQGTGDGTYTGNAWRGAASNQQTFANAISYGNAGGDGNEAYPGGGGGGAGATGENAPQQSGRGGNGGSGREFSITGTSVFYAGGGGGSSQNTGFGLGGIGGGGNGKNTNAANQEELRGTDGLGGGGGASGWPGNTGVEGTRVGGRGGRGIVIVRYPITPPAAETFMVASGGQTSTFNFNGITYASHRFVNTGTSSFVVESLGSGVAENNIIDVLIVAGGGSGGVDNGGGGGGGGVIDRSVTITATDRKSVV
jgi:hypothetical protein